MSLTWTGDTGRGHPNSPIQAELQVVLMWGNPGIALTTAPLPAMRQGPRPCLCLWVPTGSQIPVSSTYHPGTPPLVSSPMAHLFSRWCGERGAGNGLEHRSLGLPLPHLPMGSTPHLSLRHCQLVLGFASSSSLLPFFLLLLLAVETLGVRSVMDSWLQQRLVSGIYWSTLVCPPQSGILGWLWSLEPRYSLSPRLHNVRKLSPEPMESEEASSRLLVPVSE